jgi:PAS domain S-box-containing protein
MKLDSEKYEIAGRSKKEFFRFLHVYQKAIDSNVIYSITDSEGIIIYVNRKFCEICKYSENELIGKNHSILNSGFHSRDFFENMWKTIQNGGIWNGEVRNKAKDGSFYWLENTIFPVLDEKKNIVQYFSIRLPIDQKKKVDQERIEHIKSLEEMIFMTSHYVRPPVLNLKGIANQLEDFTNSEEEILKLIEGIKESVSALDSYTKELTNYIYDLNKSAVEKYKLAIL